MAFQISDISVPILVPKAESEQVTGVSWSWVWIGAFVLGSYLAGGKVVDFFKSTTKKKRKK